MQWNNIEGQRPQAHRCFGRGHATVEEGGLLQQRAQREAAREVRQHLPPGARVGVVGEDCLSNGGAKTGTAVHFFVRVKLKVNDPLASGRKNKDFSTVHLDIQYYFHIVYIKNFHTLNQCCSHVSNNTEYQL